MQPSWTWEQAAFKHIIISINHWTLGCKGPQRPVSSIVPLKGRQMIPKCWLLLFQPVLIPHCSPGGSSVSPRNLSPCLPTCSLRKIGFYFSVGAVSPKSPLWFYLPGQDLNLWWPCWYLGWQKEGGKVWQFSHVVGFQTHGRQTESIP